MRKFEKKINQLNLVKGKLSKGLNANIKDFEMLEQSLVGLQAELREAKASLMATVHQRNSLNKKLQTLMLDKINTVDIKAVTSVPINTNLELINPEQYREKKNQR